MNLNQQIKKLISNKKGFLYQDEFYPVRMKCLGNGHFFPFKRRKFQFNNSIVCNPVPVHREPDREGQDDATEEQPDTVQEQEEEEDPVTCTLHLKYSVATICRGSDLAKMRVLCGYTFCLNAGNMRVRIIKNAGI